MVQRRAARFVTGRYRRTSSVADMLEGLDWRSLQQRRSDQRLTMLYKIVNEQVAIPRDDFLRFAPPRRSRSSHPLSLEVPFYRVEYAKSSFFARSPRDWYRLPRAHTKTDACHVTHKSVSPIRPQMARHFQKMGVT